VHPESGVYVVTGPTKRRTNPAVGLSARRRHAPDVR